MVKYVQVFEGAADFGPTASYTRGIRWWFYGAVT
jgi:hypothetical protein